MRRLGMKKNGTIVHISKITKMMLDNETKQDEIASFVNKFLVSLV